MAGEALKKTVPTKTKRSTPLPAVADVDSVKLKKADNEASHATVAKGTPIEES